MPAQKDLKRIIRARMEKTGEAYTAARLHVVKPKPDYAKLAGMSDAAIKRATGRDWAAWIALLDAAQCNGKSHRDIAVYVRSLGTPNWWTQAVTVGYERVRGLRDMRQRREGAYEASKSRTFPVALETLFEYFANARKRNRWLDVKFTMRTANKDRKAIRGSLADGTRVQFYFTEKGSAKSAVAVTHEKLADKTAVDVSKKEWSERLDRLGALLG